MKSEYILIMKETREKTQETRVVARKTNRKTYVLKKMREQQWSELLMDPIDSAKMELLAVITDADYFLENQEDIEKLLRYFVLREKITKIREGESKNE